MLSICRARTRDDTDQVVSTLSKELASSLVHVSRATTRLSCLLAVMSSIHPLHHLFSITFRVAVQLPRPLCTKQLADYTRPILDVCPIVRCHCRKYVMMLSLAARSVHARVFRSLHLDFFWTYPKGIFDSLDASCLMFDQVRTPHMCILQKGKRVGL